MDRGTSGNSRSPSGSVRDLTASTKPSTRVFLSVPSGEGAWAKRPCDGVVEMEGAIGNGWAAAVGRRAGVAEARTLGAGVGLYAVGAVDHMVDEIGGIVGTTGGGVSVCEKPS